ncbi:sugar ABC transporter substrate-binding protein [Thermotoga neapolitana]|uniref:Periplasmic binding protein n=2 Tax=Thermotoga TaxID=2335 RepID=B9KBZ4_THENN|nr:sugar ABC transporter substrate-binding protein [Thermotoga neapolitana]ACM22540.1 putative periplasmic binding protein [Thermotoga neapolitana DSM 4359]KFZ22186.1 putative periplasmic binding protein [Thermotoga neapolitana LA10]
MRGLLVLAVLMLSVLLLAQEIPEIVIGWAPPDITGVFKTATDFFNKAAEEAKKHGIPVKVITKAPQSHTAFADQIKIIEDFIQRKVDVIAISPIEVEVVKPALKKAKEAGIPIIVVNLLEPIEGLDVDCYIGFDNTVAGMISAYAVIDYFGGPGVLGEGENLNVPPEAYLDLGFWQAIYSPPMIEKIKDKIKARGAIIEGIAGGFFSTARLRGFHAVIDQFPGIEIVTTLPADWNREKAIKVAEDILTAHPKGTLDFIWAASNEMGLGAMLTCERMGRTEVKIFTNDGTPESVQRIREGRIIAETWHGFPEWGWYGTKYAVMLALGLKDLVPQFVDIRPRTEWKGNADMFYPNTYLEPTDWEAIKAEYLKRQKK